jgi:hypothetical protein
MMVNVPVVMRVNVAMRGWRAEICQRRRVFREERMGFRVGVGMGMLSMTVCVAASTRTVPFPRSAVEDRRSRVVV